MISEAVQTHVVGQVITDLDKVIVEADDAYLEIVQRSRSELIGLKALSFTLPSDRQVSQTVLDNLIESGRMPTPSGR